MASRRTRSMEPNPFWSERLRDEHRLQALRPAGLPERTPDHELPPVPADKWEQGEEAGGEIPRPVADGNLGGRLGDTERSGRCGRSSAFGGWSSFQTPPSSWQSEGVLPPRAGEVIKSEGTMPSAETELAEKGTKERDPEPTNQLPHPKGGRHWIRAQVACALLELYSNRGLYLG